MSFSFIILCIIVTPVIVFSVGPGAPSVIKTGRLALLVSMFILAAAHTVSFGECFHPPLSRDCQDAKLFAVILTVFPLIMGLGWCEFAWREYHKQFSWPLWENLKYGILSNIIILVSLLMTTFTFYILFH